MTNELTDRKFWANYWESKQGLAFIVPPNYTFHKILQNVVKKTGVKTAVELGGFPGYYAIFLKKYLGVKAALFDYYVHPAILTDVLKINSLGNDDVKVIEGDLFKYEPTEYYDLVLSAGLIEHFEDTKDIIARHLTFLNPGGTLVITLPNFTGINGWLQRNYDVENYSKHNIKSMDPQLLAKYCAELGLKDIQAGYYGKFSVWLENKSQQTVTVKAFFKLLWLTGKIVTKLVPIESQRLSPYIVLTATK